MSDHRELIDATRRAHTKLGRWCRTCAAKWPCLTARLATALEQVMNRHEPCRCDPPGSGEENCNGGCFIREELASAERRAAECRAWHCSGHRQCELERGHDGRHFTTSLGNSFPGWDDSASVDVPELLEALNDARAQVSAAEGRIAKLKQFGADAAETGLTALNRAEAAERRADDLEVELAYTTSWAHSAGGNLNHMDGVAVELRDQIAALEQRAATAEAEREELTGHYEAVRDRVATLGIERAALARDLEAAWAEASELRSALVNWGQHDAQCKGGLYPGIGTCSCGLTAALSAPQPAAEVPR